MTGKRSTTSDDVINDREGRYLTESEANLERCEYCGNVYGSHDGETAPIRVDHRRDDERNPQLLRPEVEWSPGKITNWKVSDMEGTIIELRKATAEKGVFCVRHQKAELGFKMFIISHIAVACQDEIFTVVVYTI